MSNPSRAELHRIRRLLHDARVQDVQWDKSLATFTLRYDCLRRNADRSEMEDRTVEFTLMGVEATSIGYDSSSFETRPSQFEPAQRITAEDVADWPFRPQEATLWINSSILGDALASARLDWLLGNEATLREVACTFCVMFDQWTDFGMPVNHVHIMAGGESLAISSGGVPLDLDEWEKQYHAWWQGWKEHWENKEDNAPDEPSEYELAIPAGVDAAPDLSYEPPAEAAFALEATNVPVEVIRPIREWFESQHERNWVRMACIYPCPDESLEERAEQLQELKTGHDFGRWGYARSIDNWWAESKRACVVVRGIEHQMPYEEEGAENRETVWTFALRKRDGIWTIDTYSEGWPGFGSAKKLSTQEKPWLKSWRAGRIR